jgi:hypothetical protein
MTWCYNGIAKDQLPDWFAKMHDLSTTVTGVGQVSGGYVPWGSDLVCPADARLGVGGGGLSAKIYLIHEQCNLQCSERER